VLAAELAGLLQCPACRQGNLRPDGDACRCEACAVAYPFVGGIPWLFPEPARALGDWRNRLTLYVEEFDSAAREAEAGLAAITAARTRARVTALAAAYRLQRVQVAELLAPLALASLPLGAATPLAFATRLPLGQDLHAYYPNLHRDWCWGESENTALHQIVAAALGPTRARVLVLGAGAGRLAYDLHQLGASTLTVALDINPLLLLAAERITRGQEVALHEFPIAPRTAADAAIPRRLVAPAPARPGLEFVFADAWQAPFRPQSFDAVITPWLLDIVEEDPTVAAAAVNRLLVPGGRWVNAGSLAFPWRQPARRLAPDELLEVVADAGFATVASGDTQIPYMCSPASRHARREQLFWFGAEKVRRAPRGDAGPMPAYPWLTDTSLAVPSSTSVALAAEAARIRAIVLALADGRRSIDAIVAIVVAERLMPPAEAASAVRCLLERIVEEGSRANGPAS
jgi:SAM-dependent methyltransferase/uncharacterized protein YbaR (Trm112 family)